MQQLQTLSSICEQRSYEIVKIWKIITQKYINGFVNWQKKCHGKIQRLHWNIQILPTTIFLWTSIVPTTCNENNKYTNWNDH